MLTMIQARFRLCTVLLVIGILLCLAIKSGHEIPDTVRRKTYNTLFYTPAISDSQMSDQNAEGKTHYHHQQKAEEIANEKAQADVTAIDFLKDQLDSLSFGKRKNSYVFSSARLRKRNIATDNLTPDLEKSVGDILPHKTTVEKLPLAMSKEKYSNEHQRNRSLIDSYLNKKPKTNGEKIHTEDQEIPSITSSSFKKNQRNMSISPSSAETAKRVDVSINNLEVGFQISKSPVIQVTKNVVACSFIRPLDRDLVDVLTEIVQTIPTNQLYLVFGNEKDECLLEKLWQNGVATEVLDASGWWLRVDKLTYRSYTQHILVGPTSWITSSMEKVKLFYSKNLINAMNTRWIWVVSQPVSSASSSGTFQDAMDNVTSSLQEGIRGVLVAKDVATSQSKASEDAIERSTSIKVAGIKAQGIGTWSLELTAVWKNGFWRKFDSLWPRPSFDFQNRVLRVSCITKPMVFEYKRGFGLDHASGYLNEVMKIARGRLRFTDIVLPTKGFGTPEPNGSWNGMVGVLHRKEADMAPLDFSPSYLRTTVIDFSIPVSEDILLIVSKAPDYIIKPFLLMQIFTPLAWACIAGGACFIGITLEIMFRAETVHFKLDEQFPPSYHPMGKILKIFVYQSGTHWPAGDAMRLAASSGFMVALIIASVYSGSITAFFAIPFRSVPLDSAEDLMASETRPALRGQTQFHQTLVLNKNGILHKDIDRVAIFSGTEISSPEFFQAVADGTYALADSYTSAIGRAKRYETRGERCKFYRGKVPLRTDMDVFAFGKNSPFLFAFDDTIQWLKFFGIIEYFRKKYYALPCVAEVSSSGPKPMSVLQAQGGLYVLGIGLLIGTAAFVLEFVWDRFSFCFKLNKKEQYGY